LRHQAGHEGHVARQTIELGHYDRALPGAASGQRCGKLWAPIECICSFARLRLDELGGDREPFRLGERVTAAR
jgi:hypothetical protein